MQARRILSLIVIVFAGSFVVVRGIVPAVTVIQNDFPNYYTAGVIARTGSSAERLYDDAWFQQKMYDQGISQQGKFSPFPPATAVLFVPLSLLQPLDALRVLTALNALFLAGSIVLFSRLFCIPLSESTALILLSGWGLVNGFRFGQLYIALSFCMLAALYAQRQGLQAASGVAIGSLLPIKYFSLVLLLDATLKQRWRTVFWAMLVSGAIVATSIAVLGWEPHHQWLMSVLGDHLQGNLSQQDPYASTFQSLHSLLRRMFVFDAARNPQPLVHSAMLYSLLLYTIILICIVPGVVATVRLLRRDAATETTLAVLCTLALLLAPATATYHFVLLWLPVGILLRHYVDNGERMLTLLTLCVFAAIGFLPYSWFDRFDGRGIVTIAAYPRLLLLAVLYLLSVRAAHTPRLN